MITLAGTLIGFVLTARHYQMPERFPYESLKDVKWPLVFTIARKLKLQEAKLPILPAIFRN